VSVQRLALAYSLGNQHLWQVPRSALSCRRTASLASLHHDSRCRPALNVGYLPSWALSPAWPTGATGVFVIPAVPHLNSLDLSKEELIQALGVSFTVSTIALTVALRWSGQFRFATAGSSLLAVVPALMGMFIGQHVRSRLEPDSFRKWFFVGLVV